jgi:WXG100 family type VII secretion target
MFGGIFKLMFDVVEGVVSQIMSQVRIIEEAVTSPLRALVGQVMGGIWKGDGADKFVQEMTQEVIPMLVNIMNVNNTYSSAIRRSIDRMRQAEQQAAQQANTLMEVFGQIF